MAAATTSTRTAKRTNTQPGLGSAGRDARRTSRKTSRSVGMRPRTEQPRLSFQFNIENLSNKVYLLSKESTMVQGQVLDSAPVLGVSEDSILTSTCRVRQLCGKGRRRHDHTLRCAGAWPQRHPCRRHRVRSGWKRRCAERAGKSPNSRPLHGPAFPMKRAVEAEVDAPSSGP